MIDEKEKTLQLINKLMQHYKVTTGKELAAKIGVAQTTVSGWKLRNSVNAIRKKIYELGLDIDIENKEKRVPSVTAKEFIYLLLDAIKYKDLEIRELKEEVRRLKNG